MPADQADLLTQVETLTESLKTANASLTTANSALAAMTGERDGLKTKLATAEGSVSALTSERDTLKADKATLEAENAKLKSEKESFDTKLASELAKHGIRKEALKTGAENKSDKPMTATEKLLAARGVSSIDELSVKRVTD